MIEAIAHSALYKPTAKLFASLAVLRQLTAAISETTDFRAYGVRIAIEAIWNIIEVGGQEAIQSMATEEEIVRTIKRTFERVMRNGYKLDDKCLRNELIILANYIATCPESHQFFVGSKAVYSNGPEPVEGELCLLETMLYYATHDEL